LTPNRTEFQLVAGCSDNSLETIMAEAHHVIERFGLEGLMITLDRDGAVLALKGEEPRHIPTRPRAVYDNTGAGDAVLAMLVAAHVSGADWEEATRLTNVAGGLEVEKFGCVPISREEVIADLRLSTSAAGLKVRDRKSLAVELQLRKSRGETVVFTNGCYDIIHAGHVRFLQQCKELGVVLVIGLNSDESVRAQNKAPDRPIVPEAQRAEVLAALQCVDYVVIYDEPTPKEIVDDLTPDVLVKGEDWADKGVVGREHVEATGGRVVLLPLVEGISTTTIVERIRKGAAP
jgi:D-beta-D-heptose 7-phosphate kinase/D-beta-D-heptose 1-phosphate adenosyltransferase